MTWEDILKNKKQWRHEKRQIRGELRREARERKAKIKKEIEDGLNWKEHHDRYVAHAEEIEERIEAKTKKRKEAGHSTNNILYPEFVDFMDEPNRIQTKAFPRGEFRFPEQPKVHSLKQLKNLRNPHVETLREMKLTKEERVEFREGLATLAEGVNTDKYRK